MKQYFRVAAALLFPAMLVGVGHAQETTSEPQPQGPVPKQPVQQQAPAPVERRASKPTAGADDSESGPLMRPKRAPQEPDQQPVNANGQVSTIRVKSFGRATLGNLNE